MAIDPKTIAIGLTGPFGSGCTTAARILESRKNYKYFRLSEIILARWKKAHRKKRPTRTDLQFLGNQIRRDARSPGALVQQAIESLEKDEQKHDRIVFDGIRNVGEIETLKFKFGQRFYLFALECPTSERWERVKPAYKTLEAFTLENERDRDQEDPYGQQVQLCVDEADVLLKNDEDVKQAELRKKLVEYVDLVIGVKPRYATPSEILMNLAYSAGHGSKCLKRQVGAVLVAAPPNELGEIVGQGFNENPFGTKPCVEEPKYGADADKSIPGGCYRDMVRYDSFKQLGEMRKHCPECGTVLKVPTNKIPPWRCWKCNMNLEHFFWPERAMSWCTAVHAEVAAIMAAGWKAKDATLYTTTYPCFQCAEKLAQAGVAKVVFTEPYPDIKAAARLEIAGIECIRFEGVRSGRFDEIFARARPYVSEQRKVLEP